MPVWIGTSGWQYKDWRGRFYPPKLAQARWLEHYVQRFDTVEVNSTFYRLQPPATFASWRARTPEGFAMTVKVNRFITHVKRLRDARDEVARFVAAAAALGPRLGPMLVQLPPSMQADPGALSDALGAFPESARLAVEFRHRSWFTDDVRAVLAARNAALVLTDRKGKPLEPEWRTANWGYVRLHEGSEPPWPHYGERELASWAERIGRMWREADDVFVYFNNDPGCWAVADAVQFDACARAVGLTTTGVPHGVEVFPG